MKAVHRNRQSSTEEIGIDMKQTMYSILRRVFWFIDGRLSEQRVLRREIRRWWRLSIWTLVFAAFVVYIMFPFFEMWDRVITCINYIIWN
jgi:hypothetical protein